MNRTKSLNLLIILVCCFSFSFININKAYSVTNSVNDLNKPRIEFNIPNQITINNANNVNWLLELMKLFPYIVAGIGAVGTAYMAIRRYFDEKAREEINRAQEEKNRTDKQFIELITQASTSDILTKANAISTLPIFSTPKKKSNLIMKDYDSANKYIKEYCKEYPYVKESVNIILNTLLIESKRTTSSLVEENSLIKLVCCEALSDITNNSLDKLDYLDTKNFNNYSGIYLYNRILDGIYLHNVNLSYAYLRHTSFKDATITKSNLDNSNLHHANFTGANLNNTRLVQCNLKKANFTGANLIWAELEYSNLVEANFSNVVADNCNFQCCLIDERTYNNYIASISTDFEIINPKDYLLIDDLYKQYAEFNLHRRNDVKLMHYKDKKKYIRKYIDF